MEKVRLCADIFVRSMTQRITLQLIPLTCSNDVRTIRKGNIDLRTFVLA